MAAGHRKKWVYGNVKKIVDAGHEFCLSNPLAYHAGGKAGRWVLKHVPFAANNKFNPWYKHRDMPEPPKESFGEWYAKNNKKPNS